MKRWMMWWSALALCGLVVGACGEDAADDPDGNGGTSPMAIGAAGNGSTPTTDGSTDPGASSPSSGDGSGTTQQGGDTSAPGDTDTGDGASTDPPPEVMEMLDPSIDWEALSLIFPRMYSAHDGVHLFQVPARVDGASVELSDWQAIPASAVMFDPDPDSEGGGVLITVLEPVAEITIAVSTGAIGGTAPLYVTAATPEEWEVGEARYRNGVEYDIPMINLLDLFDPNYVPPETPTDLACNNCHTTGAKYLEIQHTPSQAAYISDADLETILTLGMKPDGITYSVLPMELEYLYAEFHTWDASPEEIKGLIVYLRSLTPTSQGDIVIPANVTIPMM